MTVIFHVVGAQGTGKSTLILAMAADFQAKGLSCAGVDPEILEDRSAAIEMHPAVAVIFLEHYSMEDADIQAGDQIILLAKIPKRTTVTSHREVLDRLAALNTPSPALIPQVATFERKSLQADCGALGHLFAQDDEIPFMPRACVVCKLEEKPPARQRREPDALYH